MCDKGEHEREIERKAVLVCVVARINNITPGNFLDNHGELDFLFYCCPNGRPRTSFSQLTTFALLRVYAGRICTVVVKLLTARLVLVVLPPATFRVAVNKMMDRIVMAR